MITKSIYPFAAVIGQDDAKKALVLNIINPQIGGVLLCGEKGTAKSTLVRSLGAIIDDVEIVDVPLNITEDRLIGSINIEDAILEGKRTFEEGILKKAHRNILYIDEVNLLSDNIVNSILQISSSKVNKVEREGISFSHECNFILVGTMNPEEGELRSQLLDKFGLYLDIHSNKNIYERKKIIKRRLEYESNPLKYIEKYKCESNSILDSIKKAKKILNLVKVSEEAMKLAAEICDKANCEGHRGEIVIIETAKAIAALDSRKNVTLDDIKEASRFALPHRMRNLPNEKEDDENKEENKEEKDDDNNSSNEQNNEDNLNSEDESRNNENDTNNNELEEDLDMENKQESNNEGSSSDKLDNIGNIFKVKKLDIKPMEKRKRKGTGKRSKTRTTLIQGRYVKYDFPKEKVKDLAFDATLRAACIHQNKDEKKSVAIDIKKSDFREKVRERRTGSTIMFVVDASGSMGAKKRMEAVKGAIVSLLTDAYEKRDKVGMIAFRKGKAELLLDVTRSVELAKKNLEYLPTGGKTPLSLGLSKAYEVLKNYKKKDKDMIQVMVILSDGRTNQAINKCDPFEEALKIGKTISEEKIQTIVIDTEEDFIKLGLAKELATEMNADYYKLEDLKADEIAKTIRNIE